jgi:hypothetical protein
MSSSNSLIHHIDDTVNFNTVHDFFFVDFRIASTVLFHRLIVYPHFKCGFPCNVGKVFFNKLQWFVSPWTSIKRTHWHFERRNSSSKRTCNLFRLFRNKPRQLIVRFIKLRLQLSLNEIYIKKARVYTVPKFLW